MPLGGSCQRIFFSPLLRTKLYVCLAHVFLARCMHEQARLDSAHKLHNNPPPYPYA
jgi:hypothetical protein